MVDVGLEYIISKSMYNSSCVEPMKGYKEKISGPATKH